MGTLAVIRQLKLLQFVRDLMSDGQDYNLATLWFTGSRCHPVLRRFCAFWLVSWCFRASLLCGVFGVTIGLSNFPSLNNDADIISLYSAEGILIHSVGYTSEWFQNLSKSDGGWSLEMIDPGNPCAAFSNWRASENILGGTPGKEGYRYCNCSCSCKW